MWSVLSLLLLSLVAGKEVLKLNTFANFERPSKIDLSELFFGRLKGWLFLPFSAIVWSQIAENGRKSPHNLSTSQKKVPKGQFLKVSRNWQNCAGFEEASQTSGPRRGDIFAGLPQIGCGTPIANFFF
jgi:hypothetical protein